MRRNKGGGEREDVPTIKSNESVGVLFGYFFLVLHLLLTMVDDGKPTNNNK